MNPFARLASKVGIEHVGRTVLAAAMALVVIAATVGLAAMDLRANAWDEGVATLGTSSGAIDTDADGLPDAVEIRIGSDPEAASTLGQGVLDGWLHHWYGTAIDWNDTNLLDIQVLVPPPEELPAALQDRLELPTLAQLYAFEESQRGGDAPWWLGDALDPRSWDNTGDGLADAWLVMHGVDPFQTGPERRAPGDPAMTMQAKYTLGLDPNAIDSDGDGLPDAAELAGEALLAGQKMTFEATDPAKWSSRGDGIADGFLVRLGLDAADDQIAGKTMVPGGLSVAEAFAATAAHCADANDGVCVWRDRLETGPLLDPSKWDSLGDGVPDAWAYRDVHGVADPFTDAETIELYSSQEWDAEPWSGGAEMEGVVVDGVNPLPEARSSTVLDHYRFLRPSSWNEAVSGPWWDGLPTVIEPADGTLPPAVAVRGWNITIDTGLGRMADDPVPPEDLLTFMVFADPRLADSDGDGLTDLEEYFGAKTSGSRTAPDNPDTDGDGLSDDLEVIYGTDPGRRDSSGSLLTDGQEYAYWTSEAENATAFVANGVAPNGKDYGWLVEGGNALTPEQLAPLGWVVPGAVANILNHDVDGDGLKDGEELFPNTWLGSKDKPRSPTDPARWDTDGDGLPDAWEVRWSADIYWGCPLPCTSPVPVDRWPIDPTLKKSVDVPDIDSDYDISLSAEEPVRTGPGGATRVKTNGLAYAYDLNPFLADSSGDLITDMFAIHWGVENVPEWPSIAAAGWPGTEAVDVATGLNERGHPNDFRPSFVVMSPQKELDDISPATNLLGLFPGPDDVLREKGTWIHVPGDCDDADGVDRIQGALPTGGPRSETLYSGGTGAEGIPLRGTPHEDFEACWDWHAYNIAQDMQHRTNPWSHDFDGDGLPDAWEAHYGDGNDLRADELTPGSLAAGCANEELWTGLPDLGPGQEHCITYLEAYQRGLDPLKADADGGGLADWIEIALGLKPLDATDDRGEEDWDGDGLPNRVEDAIGTNRLNPDTDGDGLLDGDHLAIERLPFHAFEAGNGNLCVRGGDDFIDEDDQGRGATTNRPGGPLTHDARREMLIQAGIVSISAANIVNSQCPSPPPGQTYVLFLREGTKVQDDSGTQWLGAGSGPSGGTSSTSWDTSGDGIPDGWMAYWRSQASSMDGLDPLSRYDRTSSSADPDGDLVSTLDEYRYARPDTWHETRDGPWWGGLDPTRGDTDGDRDWYEEGFDSLDDRDPDQDNDGVWDDEDADPLHAADEQIVSWDGERFVTDFDALWTILGQRRHASSMPDQDGDSVPDFLDRARVRIDGLATSATSMAKGSGTVTVAGTLVIDEAEPSDVQDYTDLTNGDGHLADGVGVVGATIRVLLADASREALVGFGVTDANGDFAIEIGAAATTPTADVPAGTSVAGRLVSGDVAMASDALRLEPGNLQLVVVAEANQPARQPVQADGEDVLAYKSLVADNGIDPVSWKVPTNRATHPHEKGVTALVMHADGTPDESVKRIIHATNAIFPTRTVHAQPITLTSEASLELTLPEAKILAGDSATATGRLLDDEGVGIGGQRVVITLQRVGGATPVFESPVLHTQSDGSFLVALPIEGLSPGNFLVQAEATLVGQAGQFLTTPDSVVKSLAISEDSQWEFPVTVSGIQAIASGVLMRIDAADEIVVDARLKDHRGVYVTDRHVKVTLRSLDGVIETTDATTVDGWLVHDPLGPLDPATVGLENLRLVVEVQPITASDSPGAFELSLRPRFATTITMHEATTDVGESAPVRGVLQRSSPNGPVPVASIDTDGSLFAISSSGQTVEISGTDAQGGFVIQDKRSTPAAIDWSATFTPPQDCSAPVPKACYLAASASDAVTVLHVGQPSIQPEAPTGIRDEPVTVTGVLRLPSGDGVGRQSVTATWSADPTTSTTAKTARDGTFTIVLPERTSSGPHAVDLAFAGTQILKPAQASVEATILIPMTIDADPDDLVAEPGLAGAYLTARLHDGTATPFQGRTIDVEITQGDEAFQAQMTTNTTGAISISANQYIPPHPGEWNVRMAYGGAPLETAASWTGILDVEHVVETRLDTAPLHLAPGKTFELRGFLEAASDALEPVRLSLSSGGAVLAQVHAHANQPWSMVFNAPHLDPGNHTFKINGTGGQGIQVRGAAFQAYVHDAVAITIEETVQPRGSRTITVVAEHATAPAQGLHVTLIRRDGDGNVVGVHETVTDSTGQADLHLTANQTGTLEVARIDEGLRLAAVHHRSNTIPAQAPQASPWPWISGGALVAAALVGGSFLVWRANQRRLALRAFEEARQRLLDPRSEPSQIIREAYRQLLQILADAGYTPSEAETVRDISDRATRALRLPEAPMASLAHLFEIVQYSTEPLGAEDRATAIDALTSVSSTLEVAA